MKRGKELRNRYFSLSSNFQYIPDKDKYLFAIDEPKYRFNVIGTGMNGQEHISVALLEGRAAIHGVFDPNPPSIEGAKRAYSRFASPENLVVYDSLEKACNDPEADALIICTPNYTHIDVVREAVKSGKHILLEKPMATTIQDAYEIMQIANSYQS